MICLKRHGILSSGTAFPNLEPSEKAILTLYPTLKLLENLYFRNPPVLVAPSNFCARMLRLLGVESQIHLIPNGIDTELFSRMKIPTGRPTILFAGRFVSQKGVNTIIDSIPQVLTSIPDARFMFIGATMPGRYMELIKSQGIPSDNVEFLGFINNLEMPRFYSLANVYVLPSIYENCPMGVLEAMSCKTPVVAGDGGGTREIIEPGKSGLLIPPKNSEALADSIISLLEDKRFAYRIGEEGRKRVLAGFSAETMSNSTMRLYEEMVRVQ
jgi:glycosyltransferase involved in cell wall biosynthesis